MKIVMINGSPRKEGNTATMLSTFRAAAAQKGHVCTEFRVYDMKVGGCIACGACKRSQNTICAVNDDFQQIITELKAADALVFASPIYFGQISGPVKCALDRFYCFFMPNFGVRDIAGKKVITMTVSGAPADAFRDVTESYFKTWFGKFIKMDFAGSIVAGDANVANSIALNEKVLNEIRELAEKL